jgi:hypothetical protein
MSINATNSLPQTNRNIGNTPKPKTGKPKSIPRVPVKLVFTPKEVGVDSKLRIKPSTAKVSENQIEAKLFKHFRLDSKQDEDLIKKRLNTANNPFNEIKTTGNFTAVLNPETKNYELTSNVEKGLYKRLEGKAVEIKKEVEAEKLEQKNANLSLSDKFANKQGFDNSANQKAELDAKLKENQASMSAPNQNDAEKLVKSATDTIEKVTGTQDIFDSGEIGKQFNRLGVSTLRLGGKAMELSNYLSEKINAAVRYVAPDAVDALLDKADQTNRETAKAFQNANSTVTNEDNYIDNKAKAEGWKIPLESDLARKVMYAPEGLPNAIDSAVKGDFKDDDGSYSDKVGKYVGSLNPVGDVRDVVANAKNVLQGKKGAVVGLGAAIIGVAPIVGDGAKILIKAEKEVIQEGLESLVKQESKELGKEGLEKLAKEAIEKQYDEIAEKGHGVQRHGAEVTERQLDARVVEGKDPITGTTSDAFKKNIDGTPKQHQIGKNATKFTSKESLVKAEEFIKNSQKYKDELKEANLLGGNQIVIKDVKLEDVFGKDYKNQVFGKTRVGSKNNPTGTTPTDFTDGTIRAIFEKDAKGNWNLETIFPDPKP